VRRVAVIGMDAANEKFCSLLRAAAEATVPLNPASWSRKRLPRHLLKVIGEKKTMRRRIQNRRRKGSPVEDLKALGNQLTNRYRAGLSAHVSEVGGLS
jgi:hypothetical protein